MLKNKNLKTYIISFFLPTAIFLTISIILSCWPISNSSIIHFDTWNQYVPFLKNFWNNITNGETLLYTNELGMGTSTEFLNAYYCMNPLGFLMLLNGIISEVSIIYIMTMIYLGVASVSMTAYCKNKNKNSNIAEWLSGLAYSLSGWGAAYFSNSIWLFAFAIFPLIMLLKEKMETSVEDFDKLKYGALYSVILALAIISNFVIGYMICLFLAINFVVSIKNSTKKNIAIFCGASILSAIISFPILKIVFEKVLLYSPQKSLIDTNILKNFYQIIVGLIPGNAAPAIISEHGCYIYATSIFLILFLLSFSRKDEIKQKITIISIFVLSFSISFIERLWYGGDIPDGLYCRMSFIFSFYVITNAINYDIKETNISPKAKLFVSAILLTTIIAGTFYNPITTILFVTGIAGSIYFILRNKKRMLSGFIVVEIFLSTFLSTAANGYLENIPTTSNLKSTNFDRVSTEKYNDIIVNANNTSIFASGAHGETIDLLHLLNNKGGNTLFSLSDALPTTAAVFGVDINITSNPVNIPFADATAKTDKLYLYENKYSLGYGFIVDDIISIPEETNIFEANNNLAIATGALNNIYSEMKDFADIVVEEKQIKVTFKDNYENVFLHYPQITEKEYEIFKNTTSIKIGEKTNGTVWLGNINSGDVITFKSDEISPKTNIKDFEAAEFNKEEFLIWYEKNSIQTLENMTYHNGEYNAVINVTEDNSRLLITIPYNKYFKAYIDGQEIEVYKNLNDAMCCMDIDKGKHNVQLVYSNNSIIYTIAISAIGWVIVIVMITISKKMRKNKLNQKID